MGERADKEYLKILSLAARESEALVNNVLIYLNAERTPAFEAVEAYVRYEQQPDLVTEPEIEEVDLAGYDRLLTDDESSVVVNAWRATGSASESAA